MPLCRDKCHATAITIVPWRNLVIFFIPVHVRKHSNFLCCWHENRSSLTNNYELHVEHKGLSFSEVWVFETLGVGVCLLCSPLLGCRATPPFKCGLMSDFPWQLHFRCCWQKPRLHACLPNFMQHFYFDCSLIFSPKLETSGILNLVGEVRIVRKKGLVSLSS